MVKTFFLKAKSGILVKDWKGRMKAECQWIRYCKNLLLCGKAILTIHIIRQYCRLELNWLWDWQFNLKKTWCKVFDTMEINNKMLNAFSLLETIITLIEFHVQWVFSWYKEGNGDQWHMAPHSIVAVNLWMWDLPRVVSNLQ